MCPIEVIIKPAILAIFTCCFLNGRDKKAAQKAPYTKDIEVKGDTKTPHLVWDLVIEKILKTNRGEHVRKPE